MFVENKEAGSLVDNLLLRSIMVLLGPVEAEVAGRVKRGCYCYESINGGMFAYVSMRSTPQVVLTASVVVQTAAATWMPLQTIQVMFHCLLMCMLGFNS